VVEQSTLFTHCSSAQRDNLVDALEECKAGVHQMISTQGDAGDAFFIVRKGEYVVLLKEKGEVPVHKYKQGGTFGELALLYNQPRAASVKCVTAGVLFKLDRATFRHVLMAGTKETANVGSKLLKRVHLLEGLTDSQVASLVTILTEETFTDGATVCEQGDVMDSLFMVKEGLVQQSTDGGTSATISLGDCFGQACLTSDEKTTASSKLPTWPGKIVAVGSVTLLRLKREHVIETLGDLWSLMRENFQQRVLSSISMFKELSASEVSVLVDAMSETRYVTNDRIISQDDMGDTFYIIKSGQVSVTVAMEASSDTKDREIAKLTVGDYFGEMALLQNAPRMASVTALEPTTCMTVDRETFGKVLGPLQAFLQREADRRQKEVEQIGQRDTIKLEDLTEMGTLGVGTFGRVKLVKHKTTKTAYALKTMRKRQLIALKQVTHVMNEKKLLALCDHPFLINLVASFQDEIELYMVLELALGGELFSLLRDRMRFDEATARFYAACVVSAFIQMHDKKIAYRDLKPENLLLDKGGYIKICDFGFAKIVEDRTFTLCGTPEYLAPEIIASVGHGLPVDWWAMGILIYEMLCGDPPFVSDDPMQLYQQILSGKYSFPNFVGKQAREIVMKLLVEKPPMRLGMVKRGHRDLVAHPWLKPIDMTQLVKREGVPPPPFVPNIGSDEDMSNFDPMDDQTLKPADPSWARPCGQFENAQFAGWA